MGGLVGPFGHSKFLLVAGGVVFFLSAGVGCSFVALFFVSFALAGGIEHRMDFELGLGHADGLGVVVYLFGFVGELVIEFYADVVEGHGCYVFFLLLLPISLDPAVVHDHLFLFDEFDVFLLELKGRGSVLFHLFEGGLVERHGQELLELDGLLELFEFGSFEAVEDLVEGGGLMGFLPH